MSDAYFSGSGGTTRQEAVALDLDKIEAEIAWAHEEVDGLCGGQRRWRMSVPAKVTDSDLTISTGLMAGESLIAEVRRLRAVLVDAESRNRQQEDQRRRLTQVLAENERLRRDLFNAVFDKSMLERELDNDA